MGDRIYSRTQSRKNIKNHLAQEAYTDSFLHHCDAAPFLFNSQPQLCAIGANGEHVAASEQNNAKASPPIGEPTNIRPSFAMSIVPN